MQLSNSREQPKLTDMFSNLLNEKSPIQIFVERIFPLRTNGNYKRFYKKQWKESND